MKVKGMGATICAALALSAAVASTIESDRLDAPVWPVLKSEVPAALPEPPPQTVPAVYFKGSLIRAEEDVQPCAAHGFFLRRSFSLREKPVRAFVQFMADDYARAFVNGESVGKSESGVWKTPIASEVTERMRKGENVFAFRYGNSSLAGGVLGELFVRYADGSCERISTDGEFTALAGDAEERGWNRPGFDEGGRWKRVVTHAPPPASPWTTVLPYRDYSDPKQVAELEAFLAHPSYDVSHVADGFPGPLVSGVTRVAGVPQFAVNGRVFQWNWGGVAWRNRPDRKPLVNPDARPNVVTVHSDFRSIWPKMAKDGSLEFHPWELDKAAKLYGEANPNAYFMWDISCFVPHGFSEIHPDEMCLNEKGQMNRDGRVNSCVSYSSPHAREVIKTMISQAIRHLESSPYANRIIGYRVTGGHTIEWLGWDSMPDRSLMLDFSPAEREGFEAWARPRFPDLTDFSIPTRAEREAVDAKYTILWEPAAHDKVVAYHRYWSENVCSCLIEFCRHAKRELANRKLVGAYYGYSMTLPASGYSQMRAHYALKRLLDAKCVDFLMSPQPYRVRNLGDPFGDMKPFATMQAAGVVPVVEDDTRTHLSGMNAAYCQTVTEEQSANVWKRNFATALCRNTPLYHYALPTGIDNDFGSFGPAVRLATAAGDWALSRGTTRAAEVALVVSERAVTDEPRFAAWAHAGEKYQQYKSDGTVSTSRYGGTLFWNESLEHGYVRWAQAGVPVDYCLAEDLADNPGNYRLYVFLNQFVFDERLRQAVAKLRERNCTILWMYAPGLTKDGRNSLAHMAELTGVEFGRIGKDAVAQVTIGSDGRTMGTPDVACGLLFYMRDPDEVLGTYSGGEAGVAIKRTGGATTLFSGVWQLDVPFIRSVLRRAGVHIYSESDDPVEANGRFFTLHARFAGVKQVRLPRRTNVLDVYGRRIVARQADVFSFTAPLHSTSLFYCDDDAEDLLEKLKGTVGE